MKGKKFLSLLVMGSILVSSASCSLFGPKITVDEDDASDFAEDYCQAILDQNKKNIKKMSEESAEDYIDDLTFAAVTGDSDLDDVYEAWFNTLEYQIDDVDFDEETGNAKVTVLFSYADYSAFELELPDFKSAWIDSIEEASDYTIVEATLEVKYDAENESFYVKGAKKFIDKALAMFNTDIATVVPEDNNLAVYASWENAIGDAYYSNESINLDVTFDDDYGFFTDRDINLTFTSFSGVVVVETVKGYELATPYEVLPSIFGDEEFPEGTLAVLVEVVGTEFSDVASVDIVVPEVPEPDTNNNTVEHDPAMCGTYDESTHVYRNEYFNIEITFNNGCEVLPASQFPDMVASFAEQNIVVDYFLYDSASETLWVVCSATLNPTGAPYRTTGLADIDHPLNESNGVQYISTSQTSDEYLYESFGLCENSGMLIFYRYSFEYIADNGVVMDTLRPIA